MTPSTETPVVETARTIPDLAELARLNATFETSPASRIIAWAAETFEDRIVLASSFQDAVMLDLVARTGADELLVTTNVHSPVDRQHSFRLVAEAMERVDGELLLTA